MSWNVFRITLLNIADVLNSQCRVSVFVLNKFSKFQVFFVGSHWVPICGPKSMKCIDRSADALLRSEFQAKVNSSYTHRGCNCLPSCTSIVYDAETSQADFDLKSLNKAAMVNESPE